jgi:hypothetical protein
VVDLYVGPTKHREHRRSPKRDALPLRRRILRTARGVRILGHIRFLGYCGFTGACDGGARIRRFLIFPFTELLARIRRTPELSKANELTGLGMQIAFVLPTSMLLLVPVVRYNVNLFYPAMMVLLGAHYTPFVFLYGMRVYAGLAAFLGGGGVFCALICGSRFSIGGWYTAAVLFLFSLLAKAVVAKVQV